MMADIKNLKNKVWKTFSEYIRKKECLETTGTMEMGICCTCGRVKPIQGLDAGHYISGRWNSILFDEMGVHIQCRWCNRFNEGNKDSYDTYMRRRYGDKAIEKMKLSKHIQKSFTELELEAMNRHYKAKIKELEGKS